MELIVVALILCFVIGIIGSTLLVASLYFFRESRRLRSSDENVPPAPAIVNIKGNKEVGQVKAKLVAGDACQAPRKLGDRRPVVATAVVQRHDGASSLRRSKSHSSCGSLDNSLIGSSCCSYTCDLCGSSCQVDRRQLSIELELMRPSQSDRSSGPQLSQYPCGEFYISGVDVGFKCQATGGTSDGGGGGGTFFFYRGRQPGELMEPVSPSDRYLVMAALPSVPYHLWFCTTLHPAKSQRCPDCYQLFSFELCDSEIIFHQRDGGGVGAEKRLTPSVWLLACEETAGRNGVVYRGDAECLTSLHYTGKIFVYFGLADDAAGALAPALASLRRRGNKEIVDAAAVDHLCSIVPSGLTNEPKAISLHRHHQSKRRLQGGANGNENACRESEKKENQLDAKSSHTDNLEKLDGNEKLPSPLTMSAMRMAVKWPITQIENLIESSSSDDRMAAAAEAVEVAGAAVPDQRLRLPKITEDKGATKCDGDSLSIRLGDCEEN